MFFKACVSWFVLLTFVSSPKLLAHDESGSGVLSNQEIMEAYFEVQQKLLVQAAAEAHFDKSGLTSADLVRKTGEGLMGIPLRMPSSELIAPVFDELLEDLAEYLKHRDFHPHEGKKDRVRWRWLWVSFDIVHSISKGFNHSIEGAAEDIFVGVRRYGSVGGTAGASASVGVEIVEHGTPVINKVANKFPFCAVLQYLIWKKYIRGFNKVVSPMLPWQQKIRGQNIEALRINPQSGFWRQLETAVVSVLLPYGEKFDFGFQLKGGYHKRIKAAFARFWFERGLAMQLLEVRQEIASEFALKNKPPKAKPKTFKQRIEIMASRHKKWIVKFGNEYEIFFNQGLGYQGRAEYVGGFAADLDIVFEKGLTPVDRRLLVSMHVEAFYSLLAMQEEFIKRMYAENKLTFAEKMHWKAFTAHQQKVVDGYETGLHVALSKIDIDKLTGEEVLQLKKVIFKQTQKVLKYATSTNLDMKFLSKREKSVKELYPRQPTHALAGVQNSCSKFFSGGAGKFAKDIAKTVFYGYAFYKVSGTIGHGAMWVLFGEHDHSDHDDHAHH